VLEQQQSHPLIKFSSSPVIEKLAACFQLGNGQESFYDDDV